MTTVCLGPGPSGAVYRHRRTFWCAVSALAFVALCAAAPHTSAAPLRNVALHRPYTLSPAPNYALTTDAADLTQLTDGRRTNGTRLWTSRESVGWQGARLVTITVDLGAVQPVHAVTFSTAAGTAGVQWPSAILIATSVDGTLYAPVADLVERDRLAHGAPPATGYAQHVFRAEGLGALARYVRLLVDPQGSYVFTDEVEVWSDENAPAARPLARISDTEDYFFSAWLPARLLAIAAREDLEMARHRLLLARLATELGRRFHDQIDSLAKRLDAMSVEDWQRVRATAPLNALQAELFSVIGALDALEGRERLALWPTRSWDFLSPHERSDSARAPPTTLLTMRGERRAAAFNLRNQTGSPLEVRVRVALDGKPNPPQLRLGQVLWTVGTDGRLLASAIAPLAPDPRGAVLTLPAGLTMQLWLTVMSGGWSDGLHSGAIEVVAGDAVLAHRSLSVEQLPLALPARPALATAGWDYSDAVGQYALTPANVDAFVSLLRESGAVLPWASGTVLPYGKFDEQGGWLDRPPTTALDAWLARWPDALRYRVFVSGGATLAGLPAGTPAFRAAVQNWTVFWAGRFREAGIDPRRVDLLFVDEPQGPERVARTLAWARPVRAAAMGFRIWTNPIYPAARSVPAELVAASDTFCIERSALIAPASGYPNWLKELRAAGRSVEVYATAGPAHLRDPYGYYRLQAWRAFAAGAEVSSFWSFADNGGASSFREYAAPRTPYTPLFIEVDRVLSSRHWEALLEGITDAQYLNLLAEKIRRAGAGTAAAEAASLLTHALASVLAQDDGGLNPWPDARRDARLADTEREKVARALVELSAAGSAR